MAPIGQSYSCCKITGRGVRTEGGPDSGNTFFERLEQDVEGQGNNGGVGVGIPDGQVPGIGAWYKAGRGGEVKGQDDQGRDELHFSEWWVDGGGLVDK
jgi:hypothetical protein